MNLKSNLKLLRRAENKNRIEEGEGQKKKLKIGRKETEDSEEIEKERKQKWRGEEKRTEEIDAVEIREIVMK